MCGRNKSGFELRGCEINAAIKTAIKEARELLQIALLCAGQICNRSRRKEEAKHRSDAMEGRLRFQVAQRRARRRFKLAAQFLEQLPTIDSLQLAQLCETSCHRQRIS